MPIFRSLARIALLAGVLLLTKGCTTLLPDRTPETPEAIGACHTFLARIDREVRSDGAVNGASFKIEGFPYLRTNRFLVAMEDRVVTRDQTQAWLEAMHAIDLDARRKEILNLSEARFQEIIVTMPGLDDRGALVLRVSQCSRDLFSHHRYETDLRYRVRSEASIPDEYQLWRRLVGLYPLVSLPVAYVTDVVYDEFREWHATAPEDLPLAGRLVTTGPAAAAADGFDPRSLFVPERLDALGMPRLAAEDRRRLAAHFAPVISQDVVEDYDRIGTLRWEDGRVRVSVAQATAYYYYSYGLLFGRPVLQINYTFWYSGRDGPNAPWFERGPLDGITVRITIDHRARPFMVDLMNNCGCYHFFIPRREAVKAVREIVLETDPLVPAWMPTAFPEKRLRLRVNSGWHQVQNVGTIARSATWRTYVLEPYDRLESLPDEDGRARSVFDADGIAHDSERIEPLLFFSMGIPAVGSMRQRGRHAIKLVGRGYFDDPFLMEQSFEFIRPYWDLPDEDPSATP